MKFLLNTVILLIFCLFNLGCKSQNIPNKEKSKCGKLDKHLIDHYRDTLLSDYASRKFPELRNYIEPNDDLIRLDVSSCNDTLVTIEDFIENQKIKIEFRKSNIDLTTHEVSYVEITENDPKFIDEVDGRPAFGLFSDEMQVTAIKVLDIRIGDEKISVPTEEFSNLFFPNFCNNFKSIKPITAYKSKNKKLIFIYIFGGNGLTNQTSELREVRSFLAKLIFDLDEGYKGKIVLSNSELDAYQWDCPNFKGI